MKCIVFLIIRVFVRACNIIIFYWEIVVLFSCLLDSADYISQYTFCVFWRGMVLASVRKGKICKNPVFEQNNYIIKSDSFSQKKGKNFIRSVYNLEKHIRSLVHPAEFKTIDVEILLKILNKQTIAALLVTSLELLNVSISEIKSAINLQSLIAEVKEENILLLKENLDNQKKMSTLQNHIIEKKSSELRSFESYVKTEFGTFASAFEKTCSSLMPQANIQAAWKQGLTSADDQNISTTKSKGRLDNVNVARSGNI